MQRRLSINSVSSTSSSESNDSSVDIPRNQLHRDRVIAAIYERSNQRAAIAAHLRQRAGQP